MVVVTVVAVKVLVMLVLAVAVTSSAGRVLVEKVSKMRVNGKSKREGKQRQDFLSSR